MIDRKHKITIIPLFFFILFCFLSHSIFLFTRTMVRPFPGSLYERNYKTTDERISPATAPTSAPAAATSRIQQPRPHASCQLRPHASGDPAHPADAATISTNPVTATSIPTTNAHSGRARAPWWTPAPQHPSNACAPWLPHASAAVCSAPGGRGDRARERRRG
jgi:hypothetical protein